MTEAEVTDGPQSLRQDVAQVSSEEPGAGEGVGFLRVAGGAVFPTEGDVGVGDGSDAGVGDGGAADIAAKISDDIFAGAEGLKMHAPVFVPDGGIDGRVDSMAC